MAAAAPESSACQPREVAERLSDRPRGLRVPQICATACFEKALQLARQPPVELRALVERDTQGIIKLVVEHRTRRIVGATVVAEGPAP